MRLTPLLVTLLIATAAHAYDIPKLANFKAGPTAGPSLWKMTMTMNAGPQQSKTYTQTKCFDPADNKELAEKTKNNPNLKDCSLTITKDTASDAEIVQSCPIQGMSMTMTSKMKRIDDKHYSVDMSTTLNNVTSTVHAESEYVGPCEKAAAAAPAASVEAK